MVAVMNVIEEPDLSAEALARLREDVRTTLAQFGDAVTRAITQLSGIQRERLDAVTAEITSVACSHSSAMPCMGRTP